MTTATTPKAPAPARARVTEPPPTDAILALEQAAALLGKTLKGVRHLTTTGLLKHQLIDGERCIWLSDLIAYKADFDKRFAEWEADPLNRMWEDPFFHETFGMAEIPQTRRAPAELSTASLAWCSMLMCSPTSHWPTSCSTSLVTSDSSYPAGASKS